MSFGLDIGSHSIKIVELAKDGKAIRLVASGVATTPAGGMESDSQKSLEAVSAAIRKLVSDVKLSKNQVNFALPEQFVYTRLISFPPLKDEEINSAVEWQAEGYIPIAKKDAILDWEIVSRTEKGVQILLIAAPKSLVNKYIKVIEGAGLTPVAVETELIALTRVVAIPAQTALIVDFGAVSTDIAICVNRQLMFARSVPSAGSAFTRAVAAAIGVDVSQAEEYKRTYGLSAELQGKVKNALSSVLTPLLDEVKKAVAFWQSDHPDAPVQIGVLTGGTAGLPEIVPLVTQILGIEVSIGNPFANLALDPKTAKSMAGYGPVYAIATGLAMRDMM